MTFLIHFTIGIHLLILKHIRFRFTFKQTATKELQPVSTDANFHSKKIIRLNTIFFILFGYVFI